MAQITVSLLFDLDHWTRVIVIIFQKDIEPCRLDTTGDFSKICLGYSTEQTAMAIHEVLNMPAGLAQWTGQFYAGLYLIDGGP